MSQRIGLGDIWKPLPFLRLTGKTGQEDLAQLIMGTLGAPLGMLGRMWDGAKLMEQGDWQKGFERILPKMLADPIKAARYAEEGLSTRSGNVMIRPDAIDGWDVVFRAAGFSPVVESEYYDAQSAKETAARGIEEGRKRLLARYAQERLAGRDGRDVMAEVQEWNQRHPVKGTRIDRSSLLQAVESRRKAAREVNQTGVRFRKDQKGLEGIDRFAGGEPARYTRPASFSPAPAPVAPRAAPAPARSALLEEANSIGDFIPGTRKIQRGSLSDAQMLEILRAQRDDPERDPVSTPELEREIQRVERRMAN